MQNKSQIKKLAKLKNQGYALGRYRKKSIESYLIEKY